MQLRRKHWWTRIKTCWPRTSPHSSLERRAPSKMSLISASLTKRKSFSNCHIVGKPICSSQLKMCRCKLTTLTMKRWMRVTMGRRHVTSRRSSHMEVWVTLRLAFSRRSKLVITCRARWCTVKEAAASVAICQTRSKGPAPCRRSCRLISYFWRFRRCRLMAPSDQATQSTIGCKTLATNWRITNQTRPRASYLRLANPSRMRTRVPGKKRSCATSSSRLWTVNRTIASRRRISEFVSFFFIYYQLTLTYLPHLSINMSRSYKLRHIPSKKNYFITILFASIKKLFSVFLTSSVLVRSPIAKHKFSLAESKSLSVFGRT